MSEVVDITPAHKPESLARKMAKQAPGCRAGFYVLVEADGAAIWDSCGETKQEVLWAIERVKIRLLMGED